MERSTVKSVVLLVSQILRRCLVRTWIFLYITLVTILELEGEYAGGGVRPPVKRVLIFDDRDATATLLNWSFSL